MKNPLHIVVLYNKGCPATPKTIELIEECISESGIHATMQKILVSSQEEANERKFLGSPTIHINDIDIDPGVRDAKVFGFM